jgi:hypothetical protein
MSTSQVHVTGWSRDLSVDIGGRDVINHAGAATLRLLADRTGLTGGLSAARHRVHARVEDNVRTGNQTGLGHLPSTSIDINRAWCLTATTACDLLCWLRLLCRHDPLATAEPKTLRYRLLPASGRHAR